MYAYCNNNPVIFIDSTGTLFEKNAGGCGSGGAAARDFAIHYSGGAATYSAPKSNVGTILFNTAIIAVGTTIAYNDLRRETIFINKFARGLVSSATSSTTKSKDNKTRTIFPQNPHNFHPKGLELFVAVEIGNLPNGGIYKWRTPGSKVTVFEWNEDFKNGSHYHALMVEWDSKHIDNEHYRPGDLVPEPWNTTYFGE